MTIFKDMTDAQLPVTTLPEDDELTIFEERWVDAYLRNGCNAEAAEEEVSSRSRIGGKWTNAGRFLQKPKIQRAILRRQLAIREQFERNRFTLLEEVMACATWSMHDFLDVDGNFKPIEDLTCFQAKAIEEIIELPNGTSTDVSGRGYWCPRPDSNQHALAGNRF